MKIKHIRTGLSAVVAAVAMAAIAAPAMAAPVAPNFIINPNALAPYGLSNFEADKMMITTSELLRAGPGNTHTAFGAGRITSFLLDQSPADDTTPTGLNTHYRLYVTFQLKDTLISGGFNAPTSSYSLDQLDIKFWADPDRNTNIVQAGSSGGVGTEAMVTGDTSNDILLAVGSLRNGTATFNPADGGVGVGAGLNASLNFAVCSGMGTALQGTEVVTTGLAASCMSGVGTSFFAEPQPFYDVAFSANNNTGPSAFVNPDGTVTVRAEGAVEFLAVPEPGSLALVGLGLFAIGMVGKRRKA